MANVTFYQSQDMFNPYIWYGNLISYDGGQITISDGFYTGTYYGSFQYDYWGLIGGIVTGYNFYVANALGATVRDANTDALTVAAYLNQGDAEALERYVLRINDTINGSAFPDSLRGYAGSDVIYGNDGNDLIDGGAGDDFLDGGAGIDTAFYSGIRASYNILRTDTGATVTDNFGTDGADTLINIERLQFTDARIALDIDGNAGKVYRLYEAAFNREPDKPGLAYWIWQADEGASFTGIASAFSGGIEFQNKYGSLSNNQFIEQLYQNILDRPGEAGGLAYWQWQLNDGHQAREQVLYGFSESYENQIGVIGAIENGIDYTT